MITAGCDIGSRTAKAVILEKNTIISNAVIPARLDPRESAAEVLEEALSRANLDRNRLSRIVGTGYGQKEIPFADKTASEIICHAKGAWWLHPKTRMIVDIGGQDSKVTLIDNTGNVLQYTYNDKCAAGTGRFLEVMADALMVDIAEMGEKGKQFKEKLSISNQCVIFAETEVVSLINEDKDIADILNALHHAMANRVSSQARSMGITEDVVMTGGVAKNIGVFEALRESLNVPVISIKGVDPQIMGALGAALIAAG